MVRRELPGMDNPAEWRRFCLGEASCATQSGGKEAHCSGTDGNGSAGAHVPSLHILQQLGQARLLVAAPPKWLCVPSARLLCPLHGRAEKGAHPYG